MSRKPNEQAVRELAHRLWEQRGRPHGRSEEDWFAAEQRLSDEDAAHSRAIDEAVRESFPASDAPSSHGPDQPPVNAEEKWAAAPKKRRRGQSADGEPPRSPASPADGRDQRPRNS